MRLALHTWGSPDAGKTALLIHGAMSSHGTWSGVAPELVARGYYVIAPDLRGHGDSSHADSYLTEDFAEDLVESLPKDTDVIIGHSLGARALLLAVDALAPERAVYSDPAWMMSGPAAVEQARMREFTPITKFVTVKQVQQLNPRWTAEDVATEWADFQVWDERVMDKIWRMHDINVPVPKIPSLVQIADPSRVVPPEYRPHLTGLGYTIRVVKGARHVIHRDDLDGFLASLDGWL